MGRSDVAPSGSQPVNDGRMPLVAHLREFRNRMGWSMLAIFVGVIVAFVFWEPIFEFLRQPFEKVTLNKAGGLPGLPDDQLYTFGPFEQFAVRLRVSFIAGVVCTSPVWLYHVGAFITPALHRKERRYAAGFLGAALVLFGTGCVFAYLTIDRGLQFLLSIGGEDISTLLNVQSYLNFVTLTLLAFGISFLFPLVVFFLNLVGVFPASTMRRWRRGMFVGIFAVAAVVTPSQDPFTFVFLSIPLYALYEVVILLARVRERRKIAQLANDPDSQLGDDEQSQIKPPEPV